MSILDILTPALLIATMVLIWRNRPPSAKDQRAEFMREYVLTCAADAEYEPTGGMTWADAAAGDARSAWDAIEREAGKP